MALLVLLGGARSGKSALAQRLAGATDAAVTLIATAEARDDAMAQRIAAHRAERPAAWITIEEPIDVGRALADVPPHACVILGLPHVVGLDPLLSGWSAERIEEEAVRVAATSASRIAPTLVVSNEVGTGAAPAPISLGRRRDVQGRVNRTFCDVADKAVVVVAGRALDLTPINDLIEMFDGAQPCASSRRRPPARRAGRCRMRRRRPTCDGREDQASRQPWAIGVDGITVAGIRHTATPGPAPSVVIVAAADHGFAAENVSAYPQEVTSQMVRNFAGEGAAVCVLARRAGARLIVVDAGVAGELGGVPGVVSRRIGPGTSNATRGPAMSMGQAFDALAVGIDLVRDLTAEGVGLVGIGEMGIANSTSAAAIVAALLSVEPGAVCGRGTGVDDDGLTRKVDAVRRALAANSKAVGIGEPVGILAAVGGFEIAVLAGVILGAAGARIPVLLDGFITAAAALVAARIAPSCIESMLASHRSTEPGPRGGPRLSGSNRSWDLGMRLGEGSGAALAIPIVNASLGLLEEMATFQDAHVTDAGA